MKERNKKGFTLIELLAVIVILAIIALIAVPIVMNLISKARKSAAEDSAYGMVKAAETYYAGTLLETSGNGISYDLIFSCTKDGFKIDEDKELTFNGSKPSSGKITIKTDGKVQITDLIINNYTCNYKENSTEIECLSSGQTPTTTKTTTTTKAPAVGENFSTDPWETIVEAVQNGDASKYNVGDTKTIDMGGTFGTHTVRISNTTPCDGSLESETACGFVIEFADIITEHAMTENGHNAGGWPNTKMRTYLNDETDEKSIYNALPHELRNGIIDTIVISGHGANNGEINFDSTDKLYLLSTAEVWSGGHLYDTAKDSNITRQLDYYTLATSTGIKQNNGSNAAWFLRSAPTNTTGAFYVVDSAGSVCYNCNSAYNYGVSPAFRLK